MATPAVEWLHSESKRLGISIAELVRRAVDEYREKHPAPPSEPTK